MDPAHVVLWVRGRLVEYPGFPDFVEDDPFDGQADDWEFAEGQVLGGDCFEARIIGNLEGGGRC